MNTQLGKNFTVTLLAVVLALGGLTWLSQRGQTQDAPQVVAMTEDAQPAPVSTSSAQQGVTRSSPDPSQATRDSGQTNATDATSSTYDEGYRSGYQDGRRECEQLRAARGASSTSTGHAARYYSTRSTRRYYASRSYARRGVAGVSYVAPRRSHSTRNMLLTIAAPAALAAGIGGIAGGGRGAGIGALLGGGGGALYYLIKHRQQ
jgi:hypothetical protein